jgi:thiol-disulfide isomerase/thioredoxin
MTNKIRTLLSLAAGFALAGSANAALKIGDPAPKLQVASWAQGEPIKEFGTDKVYVVEFWATWCGPCRASIPQLNALYQQFKDKGVVVIGQNVREPDDTGVAPFIKKMGTNMTYRVALDDKSTETNGAMFATWMEAADQPGIPCAFIINKKGVVAWIGDPTEMTEKLWEDILTDHYDMAKAAADYDKAQAAQEQITKLSATFADAMKNEKWEDATAAVDALAKAMPEDQLTSQMMRMDLLFAQKKYDEGYRVAASVSEANPDNAGLQNTLAWTLAMRPGLQKRDLALAEKIAVRGNKAAMEKDADILDTLARIQFMNGKKDEAIATQQKAVDVADSRSRGPMKMTLERYQADKSTGGAE